MNNKTINKIYTITFLLILIIGFIKGNSYSELMQVAQYLNQRENETETVSIESLETEMSDQVVLGKDSWININGKILDCLNLSAIYSDMGMYVTKEKNIISLSQYTSTDYEYEQTMNFKQFLDNNGIKLLYVNEPTKYLDDDIFVKNFGVETYSNRNADKFISRLQSSGVDVVDLRENIKQQGLDIEKMFYRTDHHWTTDTGLWAARIIADSLNKYCGYHIDSSIYDDKNYSKNTWNNCWLGEQGRKYGETYVGLDDYTEIKPKFDTNYMFNTQNGQYVGTFDGFIDESVYNLNNNVYDNPSWHYSYRQINCINNNVTEGKVLILGDSYEQVTEPFLSLGVHQVDSLILRDCDQSFDLKNYILTNGYDTVVICYAQFMIGAHDDITSANYKMFSFN